MRREVTKCLVKNSTTMVNNMKVPQKVKTELPYDLAIPLIGINLKEYKLVTIKTNAHPCVLHHYSQ
jgi:hypothetical protein